MMARGLPARVREVLVGPVGQRFRPDPDRVQIGEIGLQQRIDIHAEVLRPHDHGIAAREKHVGDLGIVFEVPDETFDLPAGELQLIDAHELGPAEAEGAVGVAGLTLGREEQDRLPVLVLHAVQFLVVLPGHVVLELTRGLWVQIPSDPVHGPRRFRVTRPFFRQCRHLVEVVRRQHIPLRECKLEHGIVGDILPSDQVLHHVGIGPERQNPRHDFHFEFQVVRESVDLRDFPVVPEIVYPQPGGLAVHASDHGTFLTDNGDPASGAWNPPRVLPATRLVSGNDGSRLGLIKGGSSS